MGKATAVKVPKMRRKPEKKKRTGTHYLSGVFPLACLGLLIIFMYYPIVDLFALRSTIPPGLNGQVYSVSELRQVVYERQLRTDLLMFFSFLSVFPDPWYFILLLPWLFIKPDYRLTGCLLPGQCYAFGITAMLGRFIFAPTFGVISSMAIKLNWKWLGSIDFLGNPDIAFWSLFAVATWAYTGFSIVYFMANIEQIPMEIRESAQFDGATLWQYARHIAIPMVAYPIRIIAIISTVGSLKLFDLPWLITGGGPVYSTTTLAIILYKQGFVNWQYGRAAAVGVIIFYSLVFTIAQVRSKER